MQSLFHAVRDRRFGRATCFLCGKRLGSRNRTDEHVIPLWLQNEYNLLNQQLYLLNGTTIRYKQLTIPCCYQCNHDHLGPIEQRVKAAIVKGAREVRRLPPLILFTWLGKIFYGLLYKELFLPVDRRRPKKGRIASAELLKCYDMHHLFLQSCRKPIVFSGFFPASIFVFETQVPERNEDRFDFRDNLQSMFISLRMGRTAILAALQDGGALQYHLDPLYKKFRSLRLHPLQYWELVARLMYQTTLFNRVPKYISAEGRDRIEFVQLPLGGLSAKPVYEEFDTERYARFLDAVCAQHPGLSLDNLYSPPDKVMTWLTDANGRRMFLDIQKCPFP